MKVSNFKEKAQMTAILSLNKFWTKKSRIAPWKVSKYLTMIICLVKKFQRLILMLLTLKFSTEKEQSGQ